MASESMTQSTSFSGTVDASSDCVQAGVGRRHHSLSSSLTCSPFREDCENSRLHRKASKVEFGYHLTTSVNIKGGECGDSPVLSKRSPGVKTSTSSTPHVIAMVGLPARGKTFISKKLTRYLNWIGVNTKVFNLGDYRRQVAGGELPSHQFFNAENEEGMKIREQVCFKALDDVFDWFEDGGEVAVFDATNTTRERRKFLHDKIVLEHGYKLFFIESVCDDPSIVDANIKEVKVSSPDYVNIATEEVVSDFKKRISHYESQYEPLDESTEDSRYSFIKVFNAGKKVMVYQHEGHIQSRIVYYLMNIHIAPRTIYLCRHGQSEYNADRRLGGDSQLTDCGALYSRKLGEYINKLDISDLVVWTSWLRRTVQTAQFIRGPQERWKTLNEIDSGDFDGLTYEDIKERHPSEFACRTRDKFMYRYPNGESYEDLVARMEPVIMELERKGNVVVVGHQAVLRCLLGYFMEVDEEKMPWISVPLHTIIKLTPVAYGCKREDYFIGPGCVATEDIPEDDEAKLLEEQT